MSLTPFALSLLGADAINRRRHGEHVEGEDETTAAELPQAITEVRPSRGSRRATSYYNSYQTMCSPANDGPPAYAIAARHRPRRHLNVGGEILPDYTCTVSAQARVLLYLESINPLHGVSDCEWKEVFVVLRGTLLSFHRLKDGGPGKLLRSYTLQHAEVGLASDTQHTILVPQTRFASLMPSAARRKAWAKNPDLFRPIRQHIMRLRIETDQILLADASEDLIHSLINFISAGMDISQAIDERSIPRQCTVPRRRRRQRAQYNGDLNDPALLAEQERIMRQMYPSFAGQASESTQNLEALNPDAPATAPLQPSQTRDEDEIDLAAVREDFAVHSPPRTGNGDDNQRPCTSRRAADSRNDVTTYAEDMMYATPLSNFDEFGKWLPPHSRTQQQTQRYVRRCMPVLLADSPRANDVLICNGKRVKINWRMELLEHWELRPPSYKSHDFDDDSSLERAGSISQHSTDEPLGQDHAQTSASVSGGEGEDCIGPVEIGLTNLELTKVASIESTSKGRSHETMVAKTRNSQNSNTDYHGAVFCF